MTQTQALPQVYRVQGKDQLFAPWLTAEFDFEWQAARWADLRAWSIRDQLGKPGVYRHVVRSRIRIEWFRDGSWAPYTAWYDPELRPHVVEAFRKGQQYNPASAFRLVYEDEPQVLVHAGN
jgi:hypothetical protein